MEGRWAYSPHRLYSTAWAYISWRIRPPYNIDEQRTCVCRNGLMRSTPCPATLFRMGSILRKRRPIIIETQSQRNILNTVTVSRLNLSSVSQLSRRSVRMQKACGFAPVSIALIALRIRPETWRLNKLGIGAAQCVRGR